ncbi:MAG: peptidoglycan-binding domain-containing protein [Bdellovibrionota bacterium]
MRNHKLLFFTLLFGAPLAQAHYPAPVFPDVESSFPSPNPITGGALVPLGRESSGGDVASSETRDDVLAAQRSLTKKGFPVAQDGVKGQETESAIRKFQAANGLQETGILDDATFNALTAPGKADKQQKATEEPTEF